MLPSEHLLVILVDAEDTLEYLLKINKKYRSLVGSAELILTEKGKYLDNGRPSE